MGLWQVRPVFLVTRSVKIKNDGLLLLASPLAQFLEEERDQAGWLVRVLGMPPFVEVLERETIGPSRLQKIGNRMGEGWNQYSLVMTLEIGLRALILSKGMEFRNEEQAVWL